MKKIEIEIPIYRAKKLGSDDNIKSQSYIKKLIGGNYHHYLVKYYSPDYEDVEIDQSTLAINFNDMLDSKRNKIFASLSEDGKGGDILDDGIFKRVCKYQIIKGVHGFGINLSNKTIIGIQ